jgi:hypothetical protein
MHSPVSIHQYQFLFDFSHLTGVAGQDYEAWMMCGDEEFPVLIPAFSQHAVNSLSNLPGIACPSRVFGMNPRELPLSAPPDLYCSDLPLK